MVVAPGPRRRPRGGIGRGNGRRAGWSGEGSSRWRPGPGRRTTNPQRAPVAPAAMPKEIALKRARADARAGKKPSTQAGEFIRTEMDELKKGNPNVRSRKQAIAIGLSE